MSSSVFFKFKSQKEPSRVAFDGTGISVFELKRQIIQINRLGDGTEFDLDIYNQDTNEEYKDDTTIIPRSTSIIAKRTPAQKSGRGTAQRYVNGKMPTNALPNAGRREKNFGAAAQPAKKAEPETAPARPAAPAPTGGETEDDMINAMFQAQSEAWNKTQEQLANATPVYRGGPNAQQGGFKKNAAPAPSHPPPAGYVCYRCGEKGHWIQLCPTNADPNYDGRPRVKRTTGIPRSFLKTVEKPIPATNDDPSVNPAQNPSSVMVNADGEYVVALADQASWESYQKKAGTTTKPDAPKGNKELQDMGIECGICSKLMREPVKTPCCSKSYCEECIQNALLESDFVCPACDAKEVLLDSLKTDTDVKNKIQDYKKQKENPQRVVAPVAAPSAPQQAPKIQPTAPPPTAPAAPAAMRANPPAVGAPIASVVSGTSNSPSITRSTTTTPIPSTATMVSKKRPAEDDIGPEVPRGPAAMRQQQQQPQPIQPFSGNNSNSNFNASQGNAMYNAAAFQQQYPNHGQPAYGYGNQNYGMMNQGMGGMGGGPMMNSGMGMGNGMAGMGMNNGMGMNQQMGYSGYNQGYNNYNSGFQQQGFNNGYGGGGYSSGFIQGGGFQQQQQQQKFMQQNNGGMPMNMNAGYNGGVFPNQQKTVFSEPFPSEEDSPYMRKPVNPHRHARPKRIRPSDFKAVGGEMM